MAKAFIMAGGQGERFWPLTKKGFPKYRIRLDGKTSLLQKTYQRLSRLYSVNDIYIVTTQEHLPLIQLELPKLKRAHLIIEPFRNNTACAISVSTAMIAERFGSDEVVSFFPADHLIQNESLFRQTLTKAISVAKKHDVLVTIGIKPTFPATGYGYIQSGSALRGEKGASHVARFTEKPNRKRAQTYLRKHNYFWNGGIFTWRSGVFLKTLAKFSPEIHKHLDLKNLEASYKKLPSISIDYALLEKADNLAIVETSMDWCDMGSWDMFLEKARLDVAQNYIHGHSHHKDSSGSLILNYTSQPLVSLGLKNLIVIQTEQGTLICRRTRSEEAALLSRHL